jgi:hypothetical protein
VPCRSARAFIITKKTGTKMSTLIVEVIIPPTIGAAIPGGIAWRYRYRPNGKLEKVALGKYPALSLSAAGDRRGANFLKFAQRRQASICSPSLWVNSHCPFASMLALMSSRG